MTPRNRYHGTLPPITRASDDPVIVALGRLHGVDFDALMEGSRQLKHHLDGERDPRLPDGLPSLSIGFSNGDTYTGQVLVAFGDDEFRYQRMTGQAKIRIPEGALPDTVMASLVGHKVGSVIDTPGVEDWIIAEQTFDVISRSTEIRIEPPKE